MAKEAEKILLRQLYIQRYAKHVSNEALLAYADLEKDLLHLFRQFEKNASAADLQAFKYARLSNKRVKALHKAVDDLFTGIVDNISVITSQQLYLFADAETAFTQKVLGGAIKNILAPEKIVKQPVMGETIMGGWKHVSTAGSKMIWRDAIRAAQDSQPLTAFIEGSSAAGYRDGSIAKISRQIDTLATTQVNGVASNTRQEVYKKAHVSEVLVVATLDFRTTPICRHRDGKHYGLGKAPQPPYHYSCRTVLVPYAGKGIERPFVSDSRIVAKIPKDERKGKIGRTKLTYKDWFAQLPTKHQKEVLGPARLKLYQDGVPLSKMVDQKTGKQYTLAELAKII